MSPRIAIASIYQEANSFTPIPMTLADFKSRYLLRGDEILAGFGDDRVEVPGFLSVMREAGATPAPLLTAMALAGGPVTRAVFEGLMQEVEARLEAEAGQGLDGVYLPLHGALVVEDQPDGDGELLDRVRAIVGPELPIGVSLDMHAHVTQRMLASGAFFVGYQHFPHIDVYETGERVGRLLLCAISGQKRPVMAMAKRPLVLSAAFTRTTDGPLSELAAAARAIEQGLVLHASLFPVQPWLDVPDLGFGVLVCADGDVGAAQAAADMLADMAWRRRADFAVSLTPLREAVRIGLESDGLTVVSDSGDAPSAGSPADSAAVLRALLDAGADKGERLVYLSINDPEAVARAMQIGAGRVATFELGHAFTGTDRPLVVAGRVRLISDGEYRMRDQAVVIKLGPCALIEVGAIRIVVRSLAGVEWDPGLYRLHGLDPREAALIFVKSPSAFRLAYGPIAQRILVADTPGPTCADVRRIPYTRVDRPLYPLDDI